MSAAPGADPAMERDPGSVEALLAETRLALALLSENTTDTGNGRRLVRLFRDQLRYCFAWDRWLVSDGMRWKRDAGEVLQFAKSAALILAQFASRDTDDQRRVALLKWALQSESEGRLRAAVELAASEPDVAAKPEDFDADPWLLNVLNGTLDLRTGQLRPQDPADLLTKVAPVVFDPDAQCPIWLAFLDKILGDRADLVSYVQRAIGYSLTGVTDEQVLIFLHGRGANGKSTLLEVLRALLGDYAQQTPFSTLLDRRGTSATNDLARLAGARLVSASEVGDGVRLDEGLVKSLTGGDTISARFLYGEFFDFRPSFKLWLAANHKPVVRGTDNAIWRRIHLVPFTVSIPEPDRDRRLLDKLKAELPGILRWAVEGCLAWQRDELNAPAAVRMAVQEYRLDMDQVGTFLNERCRMAVSGRVGAAELYRVYQDWSRAAGEAPMNRRKFREHLVERGHVQVKSSAVYWSGFELREKSPGETPFSANFPITASRGEFTKNGSQSSQTPVTSDSEGNAA